MLRLAVLYSSWASLIAVLFLGAAPAPAMDVWYFDDAAPYGIWGKTNSPHWESMFDGALSGCVTDSLSTQYDFYACSTECMSDYQGFTFASTIWMANMAAGHSNMVAVSLWLGDECSPNQFVARDTSYVGAYPWPMPNRFDFGVMPFSTMGKRLIIQIHYAGIQNDAVIYWDGFAGCNSGLYAWRLTNGGDIVRCEYPSGNNPVHPQNYWYDVTPSAVRKDFHVQVRDGCAKHYTSFTGPSGWSRKIQQIGTTYWLSWWDPTGANALQPQVTYRFAYRSAQPSTWGGWKTTTTGSANLLRGVADTDLGHISQFDGQGRKVHVPKPRGAGSASVEPLQDLPGLFKSDAAWGDIDGDEYPDLAVCGEIAGGTPVTRIYRNEAGRLTLVQELTGVGNESGGGLAWQDCDGDGDLDLAVAGLSNAGPITRIYRNDGAGQFTWDGQGLTGVGLAAVAWADYDLDGAPDLLVAGSDGAHAVTTLYRNLGDGTMAASGQPLAGMLAGSADWSDIDLDGDPDLLLTGSDGSARRTIFYRNHPPGHLVEDGSHGMPGVALSDAEFADYDDDGFEDLALTGEETASSRMARVYHNDGTGNFTLVADLLPIYRSSCGWADFDSDGDLDVAFCGYDGMGLTTMVFLDEEGAFLPAFDLPGVREGALRWTDVDGDCSQDLLVTGADWSTNYATVYRTLLSESGVDEPVAPTHGLIGTVRPNPFHPTTMISYRIPADGRIRIEVFDPSGRSVRSLVDGEQARGDHSTVWDGRDDAGRPVRSGIYFCTLSTGGKRETIKLILLR